MAVLGLVSTGAFAAPATAKAMKNSNSDQAFWNTVIDRNQDNAYFVMPQPGRVKVTGEVDTRLARTSKGGANTNSNAGYAAGKSKTAFNLHSAEVYLDAGLPSFMLGGNPLNTMVHVALAHDYDLTANNLNDKTIGAVAGITRLDNSSKMFFPEAYAMMTYEHLFAKVGRQYVNFGSILHDSISTPLTEELSKTNQTGVTLGLMNLYGFYGDVAFYNGASYGNSNNDIRSNQNKVHGFAAELGYAMRNNNYHLNGYVDYISNMADVAALNYNLVNYKLLGGGTVRLANKDKVPGIAVHGDFTMQAGSDSSFTVMADYVTATKKFNAQDWTFDNSGAKPQAYGVEGDYTFLKHHTITLGFQGSKQAAGIYAAGADLSATNTFPMPKTRLLAGYTYELNKYVSFGAEYTNDKDYGTSDSSVFTNNTGAQTSYAGSGNTNNTIVGRIKVKF